MYGIIENNVVVNNVIADADYAAEQGWVLIPQGVGIGWSYKDNNFIEPLPIIDIEPNIQPTKEDLLAQINALMQQVQALP